MAPTLYSTPASPPARSVLICAKALSLELNLKEVNLFEKEHLKPEYIKINPQHTIPTLVDEDGFVVTDSHAIMTYLVEKYGKKSSLYPTDLKKRSMIDQRLNFDVGTLFARGRAIGASIIFGGAKEVKPELKQSFAEGIEIVETFLGNNKYIADMCPKGEDVIDILSKKSHVEDFSDPVPQLFNALTEYPDQLSQWTATVIPMDLNLKTNEHPGKPQQISVNCTVVFWSQCMSWKKCKSGCLSMGASSYRWFHDGCCECIGDECINYGLNESKCKECPIDNILETTVDDYELDYGDEDMTDYEEDMDR